MRGGRSQPEPKHKLVAGLAPGPENEHRSTSLRQHRCTPPAPLGIPWHRLQSPAPVLFGCGGCRRKWRLAPVLRSVRHRCSLPGTGANPAWPRCRPQDAVLWAIRGKTPLADFDTGTGPPAPESRRIAPALILLWHLWHPLASLSFPGTGAL